MCIRDSIYSLDKMKKQVVDLACPSHGDPFTGVEGAFKLLESKLRDYMRHHWGIQPVSYTHLPTLFPLNKSKCLFKFSIPYLNTFILSS